MRYVGLTLIVIACLIGVAVFFGMVHPAAIVPAIIFCGIGAMFTKWNDEI